MSSGSAAPTSRFVPDPTALARQAVEQNERDWETGLKVVDVAVRSFGSAGCVSTANLQERCEGIWKWLKADEWPGKV
jgi:hypothetical protein